MPFDRNRILGRDGRQGFTVLLYGLTVRDGHKQWRAVERGITKPLQPPPYVNCI